MTLISQGQTLKLRTGASFVLEEIILSQDKAQSVFIVPGQTLKGLAG